jgi:hypothetical protein
MLIQILTPIEILTYPNADGRLTTCPSFHISFNEICRPERHLHPWHCPPYRPRVKRVGGQVCDAHSAVQVSDTYHSHSLGYDVPQRGKAFALGVYWAMSFWCT